MKIDKVMNNNVVSSIDEDGQEIIVVGTGIGFQGKEGKVVDEKKIQKIFRLEDPKMIRKLKESTDHCFIVAGRTQCRTDLRSEQPVEENDHQCRYDQSDDQRNLRLCQSGSFYNF